MNNAKQIRRDLHQIPELSYTEFETQKYILNVLSKLNCSTQKIAGTGVVAFFDKGYSKSVAFRADMDALPIKEENNNIDYCSKNDGIMHACGHDGHMAILLGFAQEMDTRQTHQFNNNIVLIFQPSEETKGGAKNICDSGIFEDYNIEAIFGIHLYPDLIIGKIGCKEGKFMAKASEVDITITGQGCHSAQIENGVDVIYIGAKLIQKLYEMEAKISKDEFTVLKFGNFHAGTVRNILPNSCVLQGSYRSFSDEIFNYMIEQTVLEIKKIKKLNECQIKFVYSEGYPALINDKILFEKLKSIHSESDDFIIFEKPFKIAEDFSFYATKCKSLFMYLGTDSDYPLHNSKFNFDELVLQKGIDTYLSLMDIEL